MISIMLIIYKYFHGFVVDNMKIMYIWIVFIVY